MFRKPRSQVALARLLKSEENTISPVSEGVAVFTISLIIPEPVRLISHKQQDVQGTAMKPKQNRHTTSISKSSLTALPYDSDPKRSKGFFK